jgi:Tfp pilus assembly protein PilN
VAKKEFIGISSEYDRLRIARVQISKGGIELLGVETLDMPYPIVKLSEGTSDPMELATDFDEFFDIDTGSKDTADDFPELAGEEDTTDTLKSPDSSLSDDNFDMTRMGEDSDVVADNEKFIADYLKKLGRKKLQFGLHIPFGKTTFQFVKNVDPGKMRKRERSDFFNEKLRPIHNTDPEPDHYTWTKAADNACLIAYNRNDTSLINLIEVAETYYKGKLLINERLPDESIWAGLARTNYNLAPDDITGIIAIGESSTRIMFMKGSQIFNILPIIPDGENSDEILNTIFSKILFEIDKGELPKLNRVLIARSAKLSEKIKPYFEKQFDDVEVDYLTLHPQRVTYSDDILDSPVYLQPYLSAIGAAWAASRVNEKEFSQLVLLPDYIREKQRSLKIAWHGILILILIALTPLYINHMYLAKSAELQQLEQQLGIIENQIEELRPIATMTEDLIADYQVIQAENDRLLELAGYSQKWSEVLALLNDGISQIPQLWLTSLRTTDEHINLTGISLTREQIPVLSRLFTDANIQQVSETELREQPVYTFAMQANNYRQDIEEFLLDMPQVEFDFEQGSVIELEFTYAPEPLEISEREFAPGGNRGTNNTPVIGQQPAVQQESGADQQISDGQITPVDQESGNSAELHETANTTPSSVAAPAVMSQYGLWGPEEEILTGAYTIVLHSIPDSSRAASEYQVLREEGYKATLWQAEIEEGQFNWRIGVGHFQEVRDALNAVPQLPEPYSENHFIIRIR